MKITVVTVCYNAVKEIEPTILSVLNQTHPDVEYIIIDGGSTDGTVDVIRRYASRITRWISEPDRGVYDAMNKGIALATGSYINFMNAGDLFFAPTVLADLASMVDPLRDRVVYGDTMLSMAKGTSLRRGRKISRSFKMPACHQSMFVETSLIREGFNLNYKICADYELFVRIFDKYGADIYKYIPIVISIYENELGMSVLQDERHRKERLEIGRHDKTLNWWVGLLKYIVKCKLLKWMY
jgi:glycosyltransferase involved in cell wall biosynthesis